MDTLRKLLQVILEEEIKHQQTLAALRKVQGELEALKAQPAKRKHRKAPDAAVKP